MGIATAKNTANNSRNGMSTEKLRLAPQLNANSASIPTQNTITRASRPRLLSSLKAFWIRSNNLSPHLRKTRQTLACIARDAAC